MSRRQTSAEDGARFTPVNGGMVYMAAPPPSSAGAYPYYTVGVLPPMFQLASPRTNGRSRAQGPSIRNEEPTDKGRAPRATTPQQPEIWEEFRDKLGSRVYINSVTGKRRPDDPYE